MFGGGFGDDNAFSAQSSPSPNRFIGSLNRFNSKHHLIFYDDSLADIHVRYLSRYGDTKMGILGLARCWFARC